MANPPKRLRLMQITPEVALLMDLLDAGPDGFQLTPGHPTSMEEILEVHLVVPGKYGFGQRLPLVACVTPASPPEKSNGDQSQL